MPSRNHHYVPQYFFRRFSADRRSIEALLMKDGRHISQASIKGQSSRGRFYGDSEIEEAFAVGDAWHAGLLDRVYASSPEHPLDDDMEVGLHTFVSFQHERTLAKRSRMSSANSQLMREMMRVDLLNDPSIPHRDEILAQLHLVSVDPHPAHMLAIAQALASSTLLSDLSLCVLRNRLELPFCFGDAPVVFYNPHLKLIRGRGVLGLQTPGFQAHVPIAPDCALFLFDAEHYRGRCQDATHVEIANQRDVVQLNKLQLHHAHQVAYFGGPAMYQKLRRFWRQERHNFRPLDTRLNKAPGFNQHGASVGEMIHVFDPQPSFIPNLSFVEHEPLPEREFRFRRRNPELCRQYDELAGRVFSEIERADSGPQTQERRVLTPSPLSEAL